MEVFSNNYSDNCICQAEKLDRLENDCFNLAYKNARLIKLLDEATELLFTKASTPSRELFRWHKDNLRDKQNHLKE